MNYITLIEIYGFILGFGIGIWIYLTLFDKGK